MRVAIMQPALLPPAQYFRLFTADIFIILDSVQFNRRWYTHRQMLTKHDGTKAWLTLPIKKTSRDTTMIKDLQWGNDAPRRLSEEERLFKVFKDITLVSPQAFILNPMAFIIAQLDECLQRLHIPFPTAKLATTIPNPLGLKSQERIIQICQQLGATEYINSPGGKHLYDAESFTKAGIKLTFLPDYKGGNDSIIERLQSEDPGAIKKEIMENL